MKKKLFVFLVVLVLLMGSIVVGLPPPPPATEGAEGTASTGDSGRSAQEGFVKIMKGEEIPSLFLIAYFKNSAFQREGVSANCKEDSSKCTQADVNKFKTEDWDVSYDSDTDTWTDLDEGSKFKKSSNGWYHVEEDGIIFIWDKSKGDRELIGNLPTGKTFDDITKVEKNIIYFEDDTVMIKGANPIVKEVFDKYQSTIDWDKVKGGKTIPLVDGGSLTSFKEGGAVITSVEIKTKGHEKTETIVKLPNGKTVTHDKRITKLSELDGKEVEYDGEKSTIRYKDKDGAFEIKTKGGKTIRMISTKNVMSISITEKNGERTLETKDKEGNVEKQEWDEKKKRNSWSKKDEKGNIIFRADLDKKGDVEKINYYNKDGVLTAVGFDGEPGGEKTRIGLIDYDHAFIDKDGDGKQGKNEPTMSEDQIEERLKTATGDEKIILEQMQKAINARENSDWWSFDAKRSGFWAIVTGQEYDWQKWVGGIMNVRPGWHALSNLLAPEATREWRKWADDAFADAMLLDRATAAAAEQCATSYKVPGEDYVFIQTRSGTYQFVGSIQAEKTAEKTAILCSYEGDTCSKDYVCKEGLCYENKDAEKPIQGYFYKITWGVTAPTDESFTPYIDENGIAIKFNLKFTDANWWLYNDEEGRGSENTIELKNGANDGGVIAHYSGEIFDEICILFGAPSKDRYGSETKEICTEIVVSETGKSEFEISKETSSTTTESGEVNLNNEW